MAAKLNTTKVASAPVSLHGKRAAVKYAPHTDTATVKNRSRTLTVVGRRVSHEAVRDFFLEEIATLALHILIPLIAAVVFYFVGRDLPLAYNDARHETPNAVTICQPVTEGK